MSRSAHSACTTRAVGRWRLTLAVGAAVARQAVTAVLVDAVAARAAVEARLWRAVVDVCKQIQIHYDAVYVILHQRYQVHVYVYVHVACKLRFHQNCTLPSSFVPSQSVGRCIFKLTHIVHVSITRSSNTRRYRKRLTCLAELAGVSGHTETLKVARLVDGLTGGVILTRCYRTLTTVIR